MKRVLFYSSVSEKSLFYYQRFYYTDIEILKNLGYEVILSNSIGDAFKFRTYDLVFAYFYSYSFFVGLIARCFGKPVYYTGGIDKLDKNWASRKERYIKKWFFFLCYLISRKCIIVSETDMINVKKVVKSHSSKLFLSEHTIDVNPYLTLSHKEDSFSTIGWQGSGNIYRKGIDLAIKIYARLILDGYFPKSKFYIIGKPDTGTPILKALVKNLNIEDRVIFTGGVSEEEKVNYLNRCKFYFQLSIFEGFGIAALEASCAKNILIHSGRGGLSNPIYKDMVLFDRDVDFEKAYQEMIKQIQSFDNRTLEKTQAEIVERYSNARRENDFKQILS